MVLWLNVLAPCAAVMLILQGHVWPAIAGLFTAHLLFLIPTLTPSCGCYGEVITRLPDEPSPSSSPCVWLTIDDGPDPADMPLLLDLLDRRNATATFFFIGAKAIRHPDLVREVIRRGHAIGNHTQTHPQHTFWVAGPRTATREILECQDTLAGITGQRPTLFRAPAGFKNLFVQDLVERHSLQLIGWTARGFDGVERDPAKILVRLKAGIRPNAIILMHEGRLDLQGRRLAPQILEKVLDHLQQNGLHTARVLC